MISPKFYVLEHNMTTPLISSHKLQYKYAECIQCGPYSVARVGGIGVEFTGTEQLTDIGWIGDGLSAKPLVFAELYSRQMTGWRQGFLEIKIAPELADLDIQYHELVVVGHARHYTQHVPLRIKEECASCGRRFYERPKKKLAVPIECWDGSDIFLIDEIPGVYVITEAMQRVLIDNGFTGVTITPVDEWLDALLRFAQFLGLPDDSIDDLPDFPE